MKEYEMQILIDELQKLVVEKAKEIDYLKRVEIAGLKREVERLEAQVKTNKENK